MSSGSTRGLGAESKAISGTGVCAAAPSAQSAVAASRIGNKLFMELSSTRVCLPVIVWICSRAGPPLVKEGQARPAMHQCSADDRARGLRLQDELLDAPGFDLADHDLVGVAAIHHMDHLEAAELLAGMAEAAEDRAVELHLVDLARDSPAAWTVAVRVGVGSEQILVRPLRDANRPADPDIVVDRLGLEVVVEDLVAEVAAVADIDVALRVGGDAVRQV